MPAADVVPSVETMLLTSSVVNTILQGWAGLLRLATSLSRSPKSCTTDGNSCVVAASAVVRAAIMKELRFSAADGEWRVPSAFDTKRKAVLLVAEGQIRGRKKRFSRGLIRKTDERFDVHLAV